MKTKLGLALVCIGFLAGCESRQHQQEVYSAWCKYAKRTDLSLTEWQLLREEYLLPGGDAKRGADDAAAANAVAASAISISASR